MISFTPCGEGAASTLTSDHMCYHCFIRQEVLVDTYKYKRAMQLESWCQYLNSLENFIIPMDFLKTDDAVAPGKPNEAVVFPFSGGL